MEIYRLSCVIMLVIMLVSGLLLIFFPKLRHRENMYMQMLNNLNVGFFSGLMVSFSLTLITYFYDEQQFMEKLFQQSRYIYVDSLSLEAEIMIDNPDYEAAMKNALTIQADVKKVNFLNYSPFFTESERAKQIKATQNLFEKIEGYPAMIKTLQDSADANTLDKIREDIAANTGQLYMFIMYLSKSNSKSYMTWKNV